MSRTVQLDSYTSVSTKMLIWSCPSCGIMYGIPEDFADSCRKSGKSYYCPNGHTLSWHENEADKQKKRADRAEKDREYWQREERKQRESRISAEHRERAQKAAKTRLKNRIGNGVCPCCKRHFANVERHIKGQHPDFVATDSHRASQEG